MPSTDTKPELTAKSSMAQPVSQTAVYANGLKKKIQHTKQISSFQLLCTRSAFGKMTDYFDFDILPTVYTFRKDERILSGNTQNLKYHFFTVHFSLTLFIDSNECTVSVTKTYKTFKIFKKPHSYMFRSTSDHHQGATCT
jgi:hypothetical protein